MGDKIKLLPYERNLIDVLGVTEEEYVDFLRHQQIYSDPKMGTIHDVRNWETAAIVLTIVGVLFQAASALLFKPEVPEVPDIQGSAKTRNESFSPKFGFNSAQKLASYGEPVNLVYANGASVRVNTALIFSQVTTTRTNELVRLLCVIGGGSIGSIDRDRTAYGQTPLRDLVFNNYWTYFNPNDSGELREQDAQHGSSFNTVTQKTPFKLSRPFRPLDDSKQYTEEGYSHAYSPGSSNGFGIYGVVPYDTIFRVRKGSGKFDDAHSDIKITEGFRRPNALIRLNSELHLEIEKYEGEGGSPASAAAGEERLAAEKSFVGGGNIKFGSANYRFVDKDGASTVAEGDVKFKMRCIEPGRASSVEKNHNFLLEKGYENAAFGLKALARCDSASYESISKVTSLDFIISAVVYKKIQGRQTAYGTKSKESDYESSDNGNKFRSAFFLCYISNPRNPKVRHLVPGIFCFRSRSDQEQSFQIRFARKSGADNMLVRFEPVLDFRSEAVKHSSLKDGSRTVFYYIEETDNYETINTGDYRVTFAGRRKKADKDKPTRPPINVNPEDSFEWDLFSTNSDSQYSYSFDNGPEFKLKTVTENIVEKRPPNIYKNLSLFGIELYAGRSVSDLRSLSVVVTKGRATRTLEMYGDNAGNYYYPAAKFYPNNIVDIFLDTALDKEDGLGHYIPVDALNLYEDPETSLVLARRFTHQNNFKFEGVIADVSSWRSFWASQAATSLLELACINGKTTLVPVIPVDNEGRIQAKPVISALFNAGNILEDSYKEEFIDYGSSTQDVLMNVVYRGPSTLQKAFATNETVEVKLADANRDDCIKQSLDISAFVHSRKQAIALAKYLCGVRRYSQRAIEFKTLPSHAPVKPGSYIYVELGYMAWDKIYTGTVKSGGHLDMPATNSVPNDTYQALVYDISSGAASKPISDINVSGKRAEKLADHEGKLFVLGKKVSNKRVFKVTDVSMDTEGDTTIKAIHQETDDNGNLKVAIGLAKYTSGLFEIDGVAESEADYHL